MLLRAEHLGITSTLKSKLNVVHDLSFAQLFYDKVKYADWVAVSDSDHIRSDAFLLCILLVACCQVLA